MAWLIFWLLVLVLLIMFVAGMCKVASDADDESDAVYESLKRAEKPADPEPPARRAGLRIVKG